MRNLESRTKKEGWRRGSWEIKSGSKILVTWVLGEKKEKIRNRRGKYERKNRRNIFITKALKSQIKRFHWVPRRVD